MLSHLLRVPQLLPGGGLVVDALPHLGVPLLHVGGLQGEASHVPVAGDQLGNVTLRQHFYNWTFVPDLTCMPLSSEKQAIYLKWTKVFLSCINIQFLPFL